MNDSLVYREIQKDEETIKHFQQKQLKLKTKVIVPLVRIKHLSFPFLGVHASSVIKQIIVKLLLSTGAYKRCKQNTE